MRAARQREKRGPGHGRAIAIGTAVLIALGATFGAGVYAGKHWARPSAVVETEAAKKPAPPRRSGLVEPVAERARDSREPLTFYQTLTAPLAPLPAPARVTAVGKPATNEPVPPRAAPEARPPAPQVGPSMGAAAAEWTVQVGVFKERRQADELRKQLGAAGVDAHVIEARAEDGQARHKVRVGAFKTRDDAARVASRLGAERRLPTYVTLR